MRQVRHYMKHYGRNKAWATHGKRTIIYKWDKVNSRLIARYCRIGEFTVKVQEFESEPMIADPSASQGKMRGYPPKYFGKGFIRELHDVLDIHRD